MKWILRCGASLVVAATVCACGGSSGSSPQPITTATPTPAASPSPTIATTSLTFTIPSTTIAGLARRVRSAATGPGTLAVTIVSVNGSTALPAGYPRTTSIAITSAAGGNCTIAAGSETCTVTIPAPPGTVVYQFSVNDASGTSIAVFTATLTVGSGSLSPVALQGVVASISLGTVALANGTAAVVTLPITAFDAGGSAIVGSTAFAAPLTIADGDQSGASSLSVNGGAFGPSALVSKPTDVVTLKYSGAAVAQIVLTASANGAASANETIVPATASPTPAASPTPTPTATPTSSPTATPTSTPTPTPTPVPAISFTGTTIDTNSLSDPNYEAPTLFFLQTAQTQNVTVLQTGNTTGFSLALDPATCGSGGTAVVTTSTTDHKTFAVTAQANGICKATVTGVGGASAVVWFSVTIASFAVNARP